MAQIITKIVKSALPPKDTLVLWDDGKEMKIFRSGKWEAANHTMSDATMERLITALDNGKNSIIEFTQDSASNLKILEGLDLNTNYICNYKISDLEIVHGTYYNGTIMGFYNGKLTEWNVNFDSGVIYIYKQVDPEFIATRVVLDIASSGTSEAQLNLERLRATLGGHFFCDIDHGLGVGTFQDGIGGYAHITTAYGIEVYYTINEDGSIAADSSKKSLDERITALEEVFN